jgi:hypothetical protein
MNFTLKKSGSTNMLTTFQVVDNAGDIRGTINVPLGAESDLTRHWTDEPETGGAPQAAAKRRDPAAGLGQKILAAGKRNPKLFDKRAVLRGC